MKKKITSLKKKYEAFNWHVIECNGNDISDVVRAFEEAKNIFQKPTCIIAHTMPGKGVSYMEGNFLWHSQPFKPGEAEQAVKELKSIEAQLKSDHVKL